MKFDEIIAIVTGGSGEIGTVLIKQMLLKGCTVINLEKMESKLTTPELKHSDKYRIYKTDITNFEEVKISVKRVIDEFGKIDVLINNAGIKSFKLVKHMEIYEWINIVNVNLNGSYLMIKSVLSYMLTRNEGLIINVSSKAAFEGYEKSGAYSASKAGIVRLTETLAKENEGSKIYVCAVCPSTVATSDAVSVAGDINARRFLPVKYLVDSIIKIISQPKKYNGRCVSLMKTRLRIKGILLLCRKFYYQITDGCNFRI